MEREARYAIYETAIINKKPIDFFICCTDCIQSADFIVKSLRFANKNSGHGNTYRYDKLVDDFDEFLDVLRHPFHFE